MTEEVGMNKNSSYNYFIKIDLEPIILDKNLIHKYYILFNHKLIL